MAHFSERPQRQADSTGWRTVRFIDHTAVAELVAPDDFGGEAPVPITVCHVDDVNAGTDRSSADILTAAVTAMIVARYGSPGDTIVSLGADPVLAGTAGAAGCDYRSVSTAADLADLDHVAGRVALIVLSWPSGGHDYRAGHAALADLFAACRMLLNRDGATIVALASDRVADGYQQYKRELIPAARTSGFDLVEHIIAVTGPITDPGADSGQLPPAPVGPEPAYLDDTHLAIHRHILMFAIGGDHRD
ncbi:hypothetical protein [Paractinoplanes rishiriensis]|nr:hypothetical protein [Actinoplanes rishiriensis]